MSDEEELGPIKLNDTVLNVTYYDSSDEDSDSEGDVSCEDELDEEEEIQDECDDETQEKKEFLEEHLEEVADVTIVGVSTFRVTFHNKKDVVFKKKTDKCDFDYDDDDYPKIYDGGENTFLPYMKELCKKCVFLSPVYIITNVTKEKYSF